MRKKMYQLRDVVAGCLVGPILLERNDAPAIRSFYAGLEDKQSTLSQYPEDYELICLGEYDDEEGVLVSTCDIVATGMQWLAGKEVRDASLVES